MPIVFALLAVTAARAQEAETTEPKVVYESKTILDIDEGLEIDAKAAKAEVGVVFVPHPPKGPTLVHLRKDFEREMKQSVDVVK